MLQSQLGRLQVEADGEVPSTFGYELEWLTCKTLLAQRLVFYPVLKSAFVIDLNRNVFAIVSAYAQLDLDVGVGSFAVFEAEVRLPLSEIIVVLVFTIRLLGFILA